ncbi:MAG: phosphate propanoyltransferase [Bacilli bacterium]|nr:phosphate propanoyltransferase [Bacilli bacterium]
MKLNITVGVSNRHCHLTEEVYKKLFDEEINVKSYLNQPGEFASDKVVTIKTEKSEIKNVRILGPFRKYNQVEISAADAYTLGINPPVRKSGNLENSETITLINGEKEITLENACIIANRHIHMSKDKASELGVVEDQVVKVHVDNDKSGVMNAYVKITDNGYFEMHIDRDDANAFMLTNGSVVTLEI